MTRKFGIVTPTAPPRYGWLFAAVWLFYLGGTVGALLDQPDLPRRATGLVSVVVFAAGYLYQVARARRIRHGVRPPGHTVRTWLGLAGLLALFGLQVPGAGDHALTCLVYIAALAMVNLPVTQGAPFALTLFAAAEITPRVVGGWNDAGYGLAVLLGSLASYGIRAAVERQARLAAAQQELADRAVQDERARIAADLHDILGHSLTVVTVKAELAQRLLDVDPARARQELNDLEGLARDALADVRATALGVRGISLPGEIAAAREALTAADVEADLPGAADDVPSRNRDLFAWTIREAVTNVVRHSHARHVVVTLSPAAVEIVDDGIGLARAGASGSGSAAAAAGAAGGAGAAGFGGGQGLAGLRRRAETAGGRLTAGARDDDQPGFRVRVEVPA
ncbi:sensor histidine kinase [Paractinoplanes brasiliensis]|uniref:Two-component system sensor histidine kinase DesK n=1 Tax=Paractinoplanes brasiliensis TaxID=52695 RepID=A0A4R6J8S9_9ACTN|nr:histidine kinase [Actinoplanes brasiliensis]TDO32014.1 two-component system sensor histidine kinase DesK [Actinoplanes brasiliensis]GID28059.1 histidine kinase [Actinoplanes brasiliensis]